MMREETIIAVENAGEKACGVAGGARAMNNQGVCKTTILHVPAGRFAFVAGKEGMTIVADHGVIEIGFQSPDDAKFILQLIMDNCERVLKSLEG